MRNAVKTLLGLLFIAMVGLAIMPQFGPLPAFAVAQQASQTNATTTATKIAYQVLLAKAIILREMLGKAQSLNISAELRSEISALLAVNISQLSVDELREWVVNASKALADVSKEVRVGGKAYAVGVALERFLNGLRTAIENRARELEKRYNATLPVESVLANMSRARDIREFNKCLEELRKQFEYEKMHRFANATLNIASVELSRGTAKDLEESLQHLDIAVAILNKTVERLEKANISETAVQALRLAISKIVEARNIVANISKQIAIEKPANISKVISKLVENKTEEALEELEELENELQSLKNISIEVNTTSVMKQIDELLQRIEELKQRIANASVEDLARWMPDLAEIKAKANIIREVINETPKNLPARDVEKAYNTTIEKAKESLSKVKEMYNYVANKSKTVVCIQIYPPPPQCKFMDINFMKWVENSINTAENLINEAVKQYSIGNKVTALILANKAYSILQTIKAQLEPLYNMLIRTSKETTTPVQATSIEVKEAKLEHVKGYNYNLVLKIKNNGNSIVKILSIGIMMPRMSPKTVNVDIGPGAEKTITVNVTIVPPISEKSINIVITTSIGVITTSAEVE
ncbi:MAG: hypothetical protein QXT53_06090 [Ignisphaera sp.]